VTRIPPAGAPGAYSCAFCDARDLNINDLADHTSEKHPEQVREHFGRVSALVDEWLAIGERNPWIRCAWDPPFNRRSFYFCLTRDELKAKFDKSHPEGVGWCLGTAFVYRDLCFIQQVDGGDEWLTIRHGLAFESISWDAVIRKGEFDALLDRLLAATPEQCKTLTY
jgi:hypothetical protein